MAGENTENNSPEETYRELERQRELEKESEQNNAPQVKKKGMAFIILILFAFFVDIIEIVTTYTGIGMIISIPLGFLTDIAIFLTVGISRDTRKQWGKFAAGFIGENFPLIAQALEWLPIRTISLIWIYYSNNKEFKANQKEKNE